MRITVIRNPASGRGAGERLWPALREEIERAFPADDVQALATAKRGDGILLAKAAASAADLIVAVGGDGTLSEVMNGMAGSAATLAVVPMGTGNDFCRTLGVGVEPLAVIQAMKTFEARRVDLIRWTLDDGKTGLLMNVGGCGFDAVVADRINHGYRRLKGTAAYLAAVLQTLASYRATSLRLRIGDHRIASRSMLCAVANARCYGGGMMIAPNARIDDGLLDVVIVGDVGTLGFLRSFPRVFKGTHLSHPKVSAFTGASARIESDLPLPVLADGEIVGQTPVTFEILPSALTILARAAI